MIRNCIISYNQAGWGGGGFAACEGSFPTMQSCTVVNNTAGYGGGINCSGGDITAVNTILWDNSGATGPEIRVVGYIDIWEVDPGILTISYSDLKGGESSVDVGEEGYLNWGAGMIDSDPLFMRGPLGTYYLSQTAAGQTIDSPCVDSGDPGSPLIDGTTRTDCAPDTDVIDMGYHYPESGDFTCSAICRTPIVRPGEQVRFKLSVQNLTDESQVVSAGTKIYLCNGAFLMEDLYYPYAPFGPGQLVKVPRVLDVPVSVPPKVKNCDLRYELFIRDRITERLIWSSSCYFQIQD